MPIPMLVPPRESPKNSFQLVVYAGPAAAASLAPRAAAYFFDLSFVAGMSLYLAKVASLLMIAAHLGQTPLEGRGASRLFLRAFSQGQGQLNLGIFLLLYGAYFVLLPRFSGKTVGMGLFGLRIESHFGLPPSLRALFLRQIGCFFQIASGGLMLLPLLKGPKRILLQDAASGTYVRVER
jgi:uncharacterized RDD family membrane protein YckC